ncbi:ribosome biogenesis GTPase YlqF [bacterium]|nr:ribosome biogenesis GTPase YlqF [bacterium]
MKRDKLHIQWYPGHIAKAERQLKEQLKLVDVVVEVLDARIPQSSRYDTTDSLFNGKPRLILMNKSDLTDNAELSKWIALIKKQSEFPVFKFSAKFSKNNEIISKIIELGKPKIEALMAKGLLKRPVRVMVAGLPNVGKSSIINNLTKTSKTKTGAKAGVTRQQQWVRINPEIELLDTPGIIPMKLDNQERAQKLAFVNSVSENAYSAEIAANELLFVLSEKYKKEVYEYYKLDADKELNLENIAISRNWVKSGAAPDIERTSQYVLKDFRDGKTGKFILDNLNDYEQ